MQQEYIDYALNFINDGMVPVSYEQWLERTKRQDEEEKRYWKAVKCD